MRAEGFRVRVAEAADLRGVVALERAIREAPHWGEAEYAAMGSVEGEADGGDSGDSSVLRRLLVAEGDGGLVGFAVGKVIGGDGAVAAELESVAVDERARRTGVGRALCGAVAVWCRERGAKSLELEVRAGSAGAIALYGGLGFVEVGRRGGYYREPVEDAVLMRLNLLQSE